MIYLDNAASTKIKDNVRKKLYEVLDIYGNPASQHEYGFKAKQIIQNASNIISKIIHCHAEEIHYTSGATMSNNLAIHGFFKRNPNGLLVVGSIEHNDIIMLADEYFINSWKLNVDQFGRINLDELSNILKNNFDIPVLVSIQCANSEIGTIQNIRKISKLIHQYPETYFHTDATQYIPWYDMNVEELEIDALSMSGQKIGCIKGTGLLYIKKGTPIDSLILGEQGLIGGTENVLGIACLGEAFENIGTNEKRILCAKKRDYFRELLPYPLVGALTDRLPNNICVKMDGINSEEFVELLNENGICASAGSACSSYSSAPSHVLLAIGMTSNEAKSCMRFTINEDISLDELDKAARIINTCYRLLRDA